MTIPMFSDKEYLERRFNTLEAMIEDTRGDVLEVKRSVESVQSEVVGNRVELAKSGGISVLIVGVMEILRQMVHRG